MISSTTFSAFCLSLFAVALAKPVILQARDTFSPPVLYPNACTTWAPGARHNVTWNVTGAPSSITNSGTSKILLSTNGQQDSSNPLATGFDLTAGRVEITVPQVSAGSDYAVVLFGDSGQSSPSFTIGTGGSSASATCTATAAGASSTGSAVSGTTAIASSATSTVTTTSGTGTVTTGSSTVTTTSVGTSTATSVTSISSTFTSTSGGAGSGTATGSGATGTATSPASSPSSSAAGGSSSSAGIAVTGSGLMCFGLSAVMSVFLVL